MKNWSKVEEERQDHSRNESHYRKEKADSTFHEEVNNNEVIRSQEQEKYLQTREVDSSGDDDEDVQYVGTDDNMEMDEDLSVVESDYFA